MSDLITLQCPNCGGKLNIEPSTISLKCQYCGMEHMLRKGSDGFMLEAYARCPVCNRNDRAEKVSAILRSQTQNIQSTTYQQQASIRQVGNTLQTVTEQVAIPVKSSQMSELARHLAPPPAAPTKGQAPLNTASPTNIALISMAVFILLSLCTLSCAVISLSEDTAFAILMFGAMIVFVAAVILIVKFGLPKERERNSQKKAAVERQQRAFLLQEQHKQEQWEKAMERWNKLYYCGRDDCVFLPGTNTSAPVTDMIKYLYQP